MSFRQRMQRCSCSAAAGRSHYKGFTFHLLHITVSVQAGVHFGCSFRVGDTVRFFPYVTAAARDLFANVNPRTLMRVFPVQQAVTFEVARLLLFGRVVWWKDHNSIRAQVVVWRGGEVWPVTPGFLRFVGLSSVPEWNSLGLGFYVPEVCVQALLEALETRQNGVAAVRIQKCWRGWVLRRRLDKFKSSPSLSTFAVAQT